MVKPINLQPQLRIIDGILWVGLGFLCLGYALFWSNFAELHLELPFLNFPIFIGEIFLAIGLVLLFLRWKLTAFSFKGWHYLLFLYVIWIFIKALWGYVTYGPLAFRNAALFYYPLFAVVAYHFYQKELFNPRTIVILLISIILIRSTINFAPYYFYPSLALYVILSLRLQHRAIRYCALGLVVFLFPYVNIIHDGKSAIMGNLVACLFLTLSLLWIQLRVRWQIKLLVFILVIVTSITGFLCFGTKSQVEALTTPKHLWQQFWEINASIAEKRKTYKHMKLAVNIYDRDKVGLSDNAFLRLNPFVEFTLEDEDIKNLNEGKIIRTIHKHAEIVRIAVSRAILNAKEFQIVALKATINSIEEQKNAIAQMDKVAQREIQKATDTIDRQRTEAIEKIKAFMVKQQKAPIPFLEAKEVLYQLSTISPDEEIRKAVEAIYSAQYVLIDNYNKKMAPPPLEVVEKKEVVVPKEETASIVPTVDLKVAEKEGVFGSKEEAAPATQAVDSLSTGTPPLKAAKKKPIKKELVVREKMKSVVQEEIASLEIVEKSPVLKAAIKENQDYVARQTQEDVSWYLKGEAQNLKVGKSRPLTEHYGNMLFRLFMWYDMLQELREWPLYFIGGINFGKPQRSKSLEIMLYGYTDWMRDGWISPHNSFLNMIYRAGIIGLAMVIGLWVIVFRLIQQFIANKSVIGIFFVSILAYWLSVANFMVFLEIPQHAITFWSFLGMVIAHSHNSQKG